MPRGDNLTREMRSKGGKNSHGGGRKKGSLGGQVGGSSIRRDQAAVDPLNKEETAKFEGMSSRSEGKKS